MICANTHTASLAGHRAPDSAGALLVKETSIRGHFQQGLARGKCRKPGSRVERPGRTSDLAGLPS